MFYVALSHERISFSYSSFHSSSCALSVTISHKNFTLKFFSDEVSYFFHFFQENLFHLFFILSVLVSQNTYEGILIMASVTGFVRASIICNFNLSISDHVAPDKLPSALGLHMLFRGLGIMIFAPLVGTYLGALMLFVFNFLFCLSLIISGFLRDYTKSYTFCIHVLSVVFLILPFLVWLLNFIFSKRRRQWNYVPA